MHAFSHVLVALSQPHSASALQPAASACLTEHSVEHVRYDWSQSHTVLCAWHCACDVIWLHLVTHSMLAGSHTHDESPAHVAAVV